MYPVTKDWGVLVLAGPRSRDVLSKITDADLSNAAFPWLSGKEINVGFATAHALRVNFVGELGWELHHPIETQNAIFDAVMEAGKEFGIKPFGIRAMIAMSIEKSYRLIPRELSIEYSAYKSGLDRFVHPNKGEFLGPRRAGEGACGWRQVEVRDDGGAWRHGRRRARIGAAVEGRTSWSAARRTAAYGWRLGKSLALGMVEAGAWCARERSWRSRFSASASARR